MPLGGRINQPSTVSDESVDSDAYVDGSIDTAHIADNQVTLAKMAGLARGKVIYEKSRFTCNSWTRKS